MTMTNPFVKAARQSAKLKLAITGPSGSGKTTAALKCARGLVGPEGKIAVIDTENQSASLYSDITDFDVLNLEAPFEHTKFSEAIKAAEACGYDAVIIDSASHLWEAILAYKEKLDKRGGNSYANWNEAGGKFREVVDCLLASKMHVISCLRSKMEHSIEKDDRGRTTIRKVGMAPIMRDGIEYEFTLVLDLDMNHQAVSSKDRTRMFDGKIIEVTEATGQELAKWLAGGVPAPQSHGGEGKSTQDKKPVDGGSTPPASTKKEKPESDPQEGKKLREKIDQAWKALNKTDEDIPKACKFVGSDFVTFDGLSVAQLEKLLKALQKQMNEYAKTQSVPPEKKPAPPTKEPEDELPMTFLADLKKVIPDGKQEAVEAYLVKIGWLKEGETIEKLTNDQIGKIIAKKERFLKLAIENKESK